MGTEEALEIARQAIQTILTVATPMLLTALIIGLAISIFQAVTQISEMTLTFIPKMLGVLLVVLLLMPWVLATLIDFTERMLLRVGG